MDQRSVGSQLVIQTHSIARLKPALQGKIQGGGGGGVRPP